MIFNAYNLASDPVTDYLTNRNGEKVKPAELSGFDLPPDGYAGFESGLQEPSPDKTKISVIINPGSERLQVLNPFPEWNGHDYEGMPLLIKEKDKSTPDHISMAGFWLRYHEHLEKISD